MKRNLSFRAYDGQIMLYYEPQTNEEYDYQWLEDFFKKCHVMQFTGKYDINKKPIYEGDIVKSKQKFHNTNIAQVRWLDDCCGFYLVAETTGKAPFFNCEYPMHYSPIEVIGNIFQNPELLQENN